jgi:putative FmdB family regulatory protein
MPLYEYECRKCERKFETLVSLRDSGDPVKCPHCGSKETDKLLSTFSTSVGSSMRGASCSTAGST